MTLLTWVAVALLAAFAVRRRASALVPARVRSRYRRR
jgi:hypothetical protein